MVTYRPCIAPVGGLSEPPEKTTCSQFPVPSITAKAAAAAAASSQDKKTEERKKERKEEILPEHLD